MFPIKKADKGDNKFSSSTGQENTAPLLTSIAASLMNCLEESSHIAGTVRTQWISFSLRPYCLSVQESKKWCIRNFIDSANTVKADIELPNTSFIMIRRLRSWKKNTPALYELLEAVHEKMYQFAFINRIYNGISTRCSLFAYTFSTSLLEDSVNNCSFR